MAEKDTKPKKVRFVKVYSIAPEWIDRVDSLLKFMKDWGKEEEK